MAFKFTRTAVLLFAVSGLLTISTAHAADVTWDIVPGTIGPGNGTITGGAGTWNDSNGNWTTDGGANNIAWSGTTETAVFGGTAGAVNLLSNVSVGGLKFNTTGYSITNSGANTIAFGAPGDIFTDTSVTATISSTLLTGSTGVTKTGAGTLIVSGSNNSTYNGAFTLSEGTLTLVPPATGTTKSFGSVVLNGGILEYKVFSVNQSTTNFTVGGDTTIRINRSGTSSSQVVTYTFGTLSIGANTLSIDKATGGGSSTTFASTTLTGNAVFDIKAAFGGDSATGPLILGNLSDGGAGRTITKNGPGGNLTWGTITLSGNHIWNVNQGTLTSGAITTAGNSLTKGGVGTLTLTGAFTGGGNVVLNGGTMNFANTTNTAGTLTLSASSALGMGTGSTSFASSVADWDTPGYNLSLTGTLGPATTSLRFGTDATGLSAAQLARTTYNGLASGVAKPVTLDATGYIRSTAYDGTMNASGNWSDTTKWSNSIIATGEDTTVTLSGSNFTGTVNTNRTVGHIIMPANSLLNSSGGSKLDLDVSGGMPTILTKGRTNKITISADLTGDNGLQTGFFTSADPNGTIVLSGNNNYTGGTLLTFGTVLAGHANALSTGTITFGGGGLASNDATNYSLANTIALTGNVIIGKGNGSNPATGTGNMTFSNTAATALGATRTFTVDTGLKATFAQAFSGAAFGITKLGAGTLELAGASTYTGVTTVNAGTLAVTNLANGGSNSSIGAATDVSTNLLLANGTTLRYTGAGDSTNRSFRFNGNAVGLNVTLDASGSGAIDFTNTLNPSHSNTNQTRTLTLRGTNTGANTLAANLANNGSGALSVTKNDAGTWTLSGTNTYTGATAVNGGTLLVNGSLAAGSAVTVGVSGTLGGNGTIGGATTIQGAHTPGNSPGIQTFTNNLTYSGLAIVNWELWGNTATNAANPNAVYDQIIVNGNLSFAGAPTLNLAFDSSGSTVDWDNTFWASNQSWTVYDVAGSTSNFDSLWLETIDWLDASGQALSSSVRGGSSFNVSSSGNDAVLNYIAVPEPTTLALLGSTLALLGVGIARRRRQAKG